MNIISHTDGQGSNTPAQIAVPSIEYLPVEIFLHVFSFLSIKDLCKTSGVCKDWKILATDDSLWKAINQKLPKISDFKEVYPSLKIMDREFWEEYADCAGLGLQFEAAPLRAIDECKILAHEAFKVVPKILSLVESLEVEGDAGLTVMTIPEGLTINKVMQIGQTPKKGNEVKFKDILERLLEQLGDVPIKKMSTVIITNSILKNSLGGDTDDLRKSVKKIGCTMPSVINVLSLAVLTHMSSEENPPTRLFGDNPPTLTSCLEEIDCCELFAGDFGTDGFRVTNYVFYGVGVGFGAQYQFDDVRTNPSKKSWSIFRFF